jgi:hypothetical protein
VVMGSLVSCHSGAVNMSFSRRAGGRLNEAMKVSGKVRALKFMLYKKRYYWSNTLRRSAVEFLKIFRARK